MSFPGEPQGCHCLLFVHFTLVQLYAVHEDLSIVQFCPGRSYLLCLCLEPSLLTSSLGHCIPFKAERKYQKFVFFCFQLWKSVAYHNQKWKMPFSAAFKSFQPIHAFAVTLQHKVVTARTLCLRLWGDVLWLFTVQICSSGCFKFVFIFICAGISLF